jgi:glycine/D-amino acid oxidase-like deaminating enzyme
VCVLDAGATGSGASGIGGGLANPMMALKGRPVFRARESLDVLESMGVSTRATYVAGLPAPGAAILRPARDEEQADWFRKQALEHPDLGEYIEPASEEGLFNLLNAPFGLLRVLRGTSLDLGQTARDWLGDVPRVGIEPSWKAEEDTTGVTVFSDSGQFRAENVLLCMGHGMCTHPLTRSLNLHGIKGQIIRVAKPDSLPDPLPPISSWAYLVDAGDGTLWIGSTFERNWESLEPTMSATRDLLERAGKVVPALSNAKVLESRTGVRVTVPGTRLPMVGPLHNGSRIYVMTGFGARGILHSAWFASRIPAFFNDPEAIPHECRVVHRSAES